MKCINNMSPKQLTILANAISIALAEGKSADEVNLLAGFIGAISSNLALIATQQQNLASIEEKKEQIADLKKQIADLEKDLC